MQFKFYIKLFYVKKYCSCNLSSILSYSIVLWNVAPVFYYETGFFKRL